MYVAVAGEHSCDGPVGVAQRDCSTLPTTRGREIAFAGTHAGDQLAHGRTRTCAPSAILSSGRTSGELQADAAQGDVGIGAGVDFRNVHHGHQLARQQGLAARVLGHTGRIADGGDIGPRQDCC